MDQTRITLLICIATEIMLISAANDRRKRREDYSIVDKLSLILGIPFLIFTIAGFIFI